MVPFSDGIRRKHERPLTSFLALDRQSLGHDSGLILPELVPPRKLAASSLAQADSETPFRDLQRYFQSCLERRYATTGQTAGARRAPASAVDSCRMDARHHPFVQQSEKGRIELAACWTRLDSGL